MSELSSRLAELLETSVKENVEGKDVAIAFSGGIDSSLVALLAKKYARSAVLYTVGTERSHDIEAAKETAPLLDMELRTVSLYDDDIIDNLREQMYITGTDSPLTLAFEMPLFLIMKNSSEEFIAGGQGADELFAGYSRYVGMKDIQLREEMVKDLTKLITQTKPHEKKMADHYGKTVLYPYMHKDIVSLSRSAPTEEILPYDDELRKKILRDAARDMGYDFLADRPKKAAQYGSGTMDAVRRVCKERGTTYNELVALLKKGRGRGEVRTSRIRKNS